MHSPNRAHLPNCSAPANGAIEWFGPQAFPSCDLFHSGARGRLRARATAALDDFQAHGDSMQRESVQQDGCPNRAAGAAQVRQAARLVSRDELGAHSRESTTLAGWSSGIQASDAMHKGRVS